MMKVLQCIKWYGLPLTNNGIYDLLTNIANEFIKDNEQAIRKALGLPEHISLYDYRAYDDLYTIHLHGLDSYIEFELETIQLLFEVKDHAL